MMTAEALPVFHLHFEGEAARGHTLPAPALVQAIEALQRSIYLLAMAYQGYELKQRARVNYELERKYALVFSIPEEGGYDLPYKVGTAGGDCSTPETLPRLPNSIRQCSPPSRLAIAKHFAVWFLLVTTAASSCPN
ncbi:MAG: hypothetical protein ACR2KT_08260 [Methylocella sp.]|nr:MAG: hypothetical protein DLM68_06010 [Hyphomicrobiales bacterium]